MIGPGGIDLIGRLAVKPVIGAAHTDPLRRDDTDMARGKRLAQGTGIEDIFGFIGHGAQTKIALVIDLFGQFHDLFNLLLYRIYFDLNLVENSAKFLMELTVKNNAEMFEGKALFNGSLPNPDPHDITLADMHDALDIVHQMMELALQDRLKIRLHLPAGNLNQDTDRQILPLFNIGDIRSLHNNFAVFDLIHFLGNEHLDPGCPAAAAFHVQIILSDTLTFKGGTKGHGNINFCHTDLEAAHLNGLLDDFIMGHIGNHMFVGTDAGGQDFRDIVIRNGGKTPVDRTGGIGIPFVGNRSERHDKGKGAVLVIEEISLIVTGLDTAECQGDTAGKSYGKDSRGIGFAKGNEPGIPANLHIIVDKQFGHIFSFTLIMHEDIEIFFLQLQGNL